MKANAYEPLKSTEGFPLIYAKRSSRILTIACIAIAFLTGIIICRILWPRTLVVEKKITLPPKIEKVFIQPNIEQEIEQRIDAKIVEAMERGWIGILEIKDNEAQTVRYKRAAIANKSGFIDLRNDISYPIYSYFTYQNIGYGIVDDGQKNFFLVMWRPGSIPAPTANPGTIRVPVGRKIEIGKY